METRKRIRAADDEAESYVQDVRKTKGERQVEAWRRERGGGETEESGREGGSAGMKLN